MAGKIELPESVKVGWANYQIVVMDPDVGTARSLLGEHNSTDHIISVDISKGWPTSLEVLLHEITHAIFHAASYSEVDGPTEEYTTTVLGNGLTQVFMDNPHIVEFIRKVREAEGG